MNRVQMLYHLAQRQQIKTVAEIGVYRCQYSKSIAGAFNYDRFVLVDTFGEGHGNFKDYSHLDKEKWEVIYQNAQNIFKKDSKVEILRTTSEQAVKRFGDNVFDFVYIDANHQYEHIQHDLRAWYAKVKIGGWIAGHDYGAIPSVTQAVNEFFTEIGTTPNLTDEKMYKTYYVQKL